MKHTIRLSTDDAALTIKAILSFIMHMENYIVAVRDNPALYTQARAELEAALLLKQTLINAIRH